MRLRTKLFLTWGGMMPVLWVPAFWSIQHTVKARFDQMAHESFDGTKHGLEEMQKERIAHMGQVGRLIMSIPELRALIAEQNFELSADNLASLQERLDYLEDQVGVSFVAVLNRDQRAIARSRKAPWTSVANLNEYVTQTRQPAALIQRVFGHDADAPGAKNGARFGLWSHGGRLYHVVAIPLIFESHDAAVPAYPEGALLLGVELSEDLARELGRSHNSQVTLMSDGALVASNLSPAAQRELVSLYWKNSWRPFEVFVFQMQGTTYHGSIEPLQDPSSGTVVGQMLVQRDMQDAPIKAQVLQSLVLIMFGGLAAAGAASYLISGAVTRPVRRLVDGVRRVAGGDLDLALPVKSRDELGQLSASFNEMVSQLRSRNALERQVEEAKAASRAKSQFLANMSHEIRTPLNGVVGMTELLLGTDMSEQQRRYAGLVKSSAELLTSLINDILDFSKIEAGKLEIESIAFDLHATVEEVVDLLAEKAARKKLELGCYFNQGVPRQVRGDPDRLRQILVNLVSNAIKFTEKGSVVVRATPQSDVGEQIDVRFSIIDTGIGIPRDRLDRLFKPFSQVDASTTRKYGGTGLGLAISHQLAELMGGSIGVESEPGRGSTFWFTVRFAKQPATTPSESSPLDVRDFRVLAVDDSKNARSILEEQLTSWNLYVETAGSAGDALGALRNARAQGRPFKVAIIDSDMQGTSGFELSRAIKADAQLRQIVLIVMLPMEAVVNRSILQEAGFAGHITKPVRQSQLLDSIMRAIARERAGPRLETVTEPLQQPAAASATARRLILVVEDNEINQIVTVELLAKAGYQCDVVANGRMALEAFSKTRYDLILMDCQMPEMDGFEATKLIRQKEHDASAGRTPIIALTANAIKGDREQCLQAGMDGYCSKPIDPKYLLWAIESLLAKAAPVSAESEQRTESPTAPLATAGLPPIVVDTLLQRCMNNLATIGIVLDKFEKQAERDLQQIQQSIAAGDALAVARTAHSLKGAAAIIAAERLSQIAGELERLGRDQQLSGLEQQLSELRDEARRCIGYLPNVRSMAFAKLSLPA